MPELPEVETTCRALRGLISGERIVNVNIRNPRLRWPVEACIEEKIKGRRIEEIKRRGKYLLFRFDTGTAIIHLGMSGSLRVVEQGTPYKKHDHFEWNFENSRIMRYHDPRRFGCLLWTEEPEESHYLLRHLGPEPLEDGFTDDYFYGMCQRRSVMIKSLIMDAKVVVGVGNIYASESLFRSGIHPMRKCNRISERRVKLLRLEIQNVLNDAIASGGSTLRDFLSANGNPGYFQQRLYVYGREGEACHKCGHIIQQCIIGQRSTFYCKCCQG